jgi:AraC-like DNA-binding protein
MAWVAIFELLQGYHGAAEPAVAARAKNIADAATRRLAAAVKLDYRNSVHLGALSDVTHYLQQRGYSIDAFYRRSGIPCEGEVDPDGRISIEAVKESWKVALEMTSDPALALAIGANYSSSSLGILGHLVAHSETLGDALRAYCRYVIIITSGWRIEIVERRQEAGIVLSTEQPDPVVWPRVVERTFATLLTVAKTEAIGNFSVNRVEFDYPEPDYSTAYRKYFGARCRFGAEASKLIFPREQLDLRMRHRHSSLEALLAREAESTYQRLIAENGATTASIWHVLPGLLDRGMISAQSAAAATHLSVRTLHRRLRAEHTSYLELLDQARSQRAMSLMELPGVSIEEIALACGFLDASGFFRAFKRWTGMAPRAYRQSKQAVKTVEIGQAKTGPSLP